MKLTTEQLLKVLEENKEELKPTRTSVSDVHKFIEDLKLKEGQKRVHVRLLFEAYKAWGGEKSMRSFRIAFGKYFEPFTRSRFPHYKLNVSSVQLVNKVDNKLVKV